MIPWAKSFTSVQLVGNHQFKVPRCYPLLPIATHCYPSQECIVSHVIQSSSMHRKQQQGPPISASSVETYGIGWKLKAFHHISRKKKNSLDISRYLSVSWISLNILDESYICNQEEERHIHSSTPSKCTQYTVHTITVRQRVYTCKVLLRTSI